MVTSILLNEKDLDSQGGAHHHWIIPSLRARNERRRSILLGCAMFTEKHTEISPEFLHASVLLLCKVGHEAVSVHLQKNKQIVLSRNETNKRLKLSYFEILKRNVFHKRMSSVTDVFFWAVSKQSSSNSSGERSSFPQTFLRPMTSTFSGRKCDKSGDNMYNQKNTSWQLGPLLDCFFVWKTWMSLVIRNYPNKKNWYHLEI